MRPAFGAILHRPAGGDPQFSVLKHLFKLDFSLSIPDNVQQNFSLIHTNGSPSGPSLTSHARH